MPWLLLIPVAWLVPNHTQPWAAAWSDALALLGCSLAGLAVRSSAPRLSWQLLGSLALACGSILVQWLTGRIYFGGDAWLALVYLAAFLVALRVGQEIRVYSPQRPQLWHPLEGYLATSVGAASLSALLAMNQWAGSLPLGIWQVDLPSYGRPFANIAQPNHLSSVCFLGLCSAAWLHERARMRAFTFWLIATVQCMGVVMTSSRTGWLQVGLLAAFIWASDTSKANCLVGRRSAAALGAMFASLVLVWPSIDAHVRVSSSRPIEALLEEGTRLKHWHALSGAILERPLAGYGWQQVSVAQVTTAERHPTVGENIEHSHNLLLDLMVWNGIPIGLALIVALSWWLWRHLPLARDQRYRWPLVAVLGLAVHALLEYPLEYAYFLVPLGLMMGMLDAQVKSPDVVCHAHITQAWRAGAAALLLAVACVGYEYARIEQAFTTLRLELARVGNPTQLTPLPEVHLLTQLEALMTMAQSRARPGMSQAEVDFMRKTSERYSYPPAMLRYALAAGLNGHAEGATRTLERICRIHEPKRCVEAKESWQVAESTYPALRGLAPRSWRHP